MRYEATTEVLYWNPDQNFSIYRSHNYCFDEYNSLLSMQDKHTTDYLPLQQNKESILYHSDLLNFIPSEIDITSTPFSDTIILTYDIELPLYGNKIGINLLDDEDFIIPYLIDTIPN